MGVPSRAPLILIGNILPFVVGTFFWTGRVYSRAAILHTWGKDDWLLCVGWAAAFVNCILACMETRYGAGMHSADVPESYLIPAIRLSYGTLIIYQVSLCFTKLSVVVLYLRVFTATSRIGRALLFGVLFLLIALNVTAELVSIFQCIPISAIWSDRSGHCISTIPMFYIYAVSNVLVDAFLMLFAIPRILRLSLASRQKVALFAAVAMGGVPIIASIIRCVRVSEILGSTDQTWKSYDSSIWSAVDANVSILCASAPTLKPLLRRLAPRIVGSSSETADGSHFATGSKSWRLTNTHGIGRAFGLQSVPRQDDPRTASQMEIAQCGGQSQWSTGNGVGSAASHDGDDGDDDYDDNSSEEPSFSGEPGIMKSTRVEISHLPC